MSSPLRISWDDCYIPEPNSGCHLWIRTVDARGYGRCGRNGHHRAHRVAYEKFHGPIPPGMLVCHRCDVPSCVNPEHLFLGTDQDNATDKKLKGRAWRPPNWQGSSRNSRRGANGKFV